MDIFKIRNELQRMKKGDLFKLVSDQKISLCLVGGRICSFYFHYKGLYFCVSELLGESCLYERAKDVEINLFQKERIAGLLPWPKNLLNGFLSFEKEGKEFKVYSRDEVNRSIKLLGKIIERRKKERKNNLSDLLIKARKDFSEFVVNPSQIFLMGT